MLFLKNAIFGHIYRPMHTKLFRSLGLDNNGIRKVFSPCMHALNAARLKTVFVIKRGGLSQTPFATMQFFLGLEEGRSINTKNFFLKKHYKVILRNAYFPFIDFPTTSN